jgi:hypothetical protein
MGCGYVQCSEFIPSYSDDAVNHLKYYNSIQQLMQLIVNVGAVNVISKCSEHC